jgi:hypothetical protein
VSEGYRSFRDFYPFYLSQHSRPTTRALHYLGTSLVLAALIGAAATTRAAVLWVVPVLGYGPAWVGHFSFERNRPATFRYPAYILLGDFLMLFQALTSRLDRRHFASSATPSKTSSA